MSEPSNQLFPVFLKLEHLQILLVGGGNVGLEKLTALLGNSPRANIRLVAPFIKPEIFDLALQYNGLQLHQREYQEKDLNGMDLVFLATDNPNLHQAIKKITRARKILTNVADTPNLCDFYLSSIVKKGDLKIAISTNGKSPTIGKRIKEFLNEAIPGNFQDILDNMYNIRQRLKGDFEYKVKTLNDITTGWLKQGQRDN
ncbi:MAG: precorrin-2 dehydrogenase/sirohydrochlorin ferrochelatase family protein [Candidatus Cyclobacteriaceae bacterium M3_2C_046]